MPATEVTAPEKNPSGPPTTHSATVHRSVRFAVYLAGGLVTLAFGVEVFASGLGQALNCAYQTQFCSNGFTTAESLYLVPFLVGGAFLIVVATVLFQLARRTQRRLRSLRSMEPSGFATADSGNAAESSEESTDPEKAVRFAGFVLGGLVTLALGVLWVSESLGQVLQCAYQTGFCGGFGTANYFLIVPPLGTGVVLTVIGVVLLLLGRNVR